MRARLFFIRGLLFLSAFLVCTTGYSRNLVNVTNAPATVPGALPENSLAGAAYQRAIDAYENPSVQVEKGFFPQLGNYFDPATEGWGLDIQAIGNTVFAVWFTYLANGDPFWYIIVGDLETKGKGLGSVTGNIEQFTWDQFGIPGSQATATIVGQMTIEWGSATEADVSWTLDSVDGSAEVEFIQFSTDPTLIDMTGHYFPFFAAGWGFTLLTQGQVTVMTMYWYKNGQPVWAQGVAPTWGKNPIIELLYFTGPGLCPACLPRKGISGGPGITPLTSVQLNYAVDVPPFANLTWTEIFGKGGPLGSQPFSDIPLNFGPVAAQGITSAFGDDFDEDYDWFINGKGTGAVYKYGRNRTFVVGGETVAPFVIAFEPFSLPPPFASVLANPDAGWVMKIPFPTTKGPQCVPFQFDDGGLGFPSVVTGNIQTGYIQLPPTGGQLAVYSNASCTTPLQRLAAGKPAQGQIRMGPAGDGHLIRFFSESSFSKSEFDKHDDDGDDGD